jgi:hypothetical protein
LIKRDRSLVAPGGDVKDVDESDSQLRADLNPRAELSGERWLEMDDENNQIAHAQLVQEKNTSDYGAIWNSSGTGAVINHNAARRRRTTRLVSKWRLL